MKRKMWLFYNDLTIIVIKAPKKEDAEKQFTESFREAGESNAFTCTELTLELLDQLTDGVDFADADYEFHVAPGGDM